MLQQVLPEAQVSQVGEVADAAGQRRKLIIGKHQFLHEREIIKSLKAQECSLVLPLPRLKGVVERRHCGTTSS